MELVNRQWLLRSRPSGTAVAADFEYREQKLGCVDLLPGHLLVKNEFFVMAPTMRNWMSSAGNNLYPSIPLGDPVRALAAGVVIESADPTFASGQRVFATSSWQDYVVIDAKVPGLRTMPPTISYQAALGPLGMNAITAYVGMTMVGSPVPGETVVVSAAAGSTGSIAAQTARILGCRVIGIAGGAEKCRWLVDECHLDEAIDYKSGLEEHLRAACPEGIDVYFDNVGGPTLQLAVDMMRTGGRIVLCGQISEYDSGAEIPGPTNMMRFIYGGIRMQGFTLRNFPDVVSLAERQLREWLDAGLIAHREDVRHGFGLIPGAFGSLFDGSHRGTLMVKADT
ncbi:unannotated protein [freshwater metagenome]|uniref:Unannotated protein n=1 Tax=freshwater metagenome TaxID=449393 RepID=A0A6J6ZG98_9ZZZZ